MAFRKKQIGRQENLHQEKSAGRGWGKLFGHVSSGSLIFVCLLGAITLVSFSRDSLGEIALDSAATVIGSELKTDPQGHINILLTGIGGGETHAEKGHKLTDVMIVASLDPEDKSVVMLSLPRDIWTEEYQGRLNEVFRDASLEIQQRMLAEPSNAAVLERVEGIEYREFLWEIERQADKQAMEVLRDEVSRITSIDIQYVARGDFSAITQSIDAVGGVEVNVEKTINDPTYPDDEWGYDPFYLEAGLQELDGETALKYARSRHGSSDFDRSQRQQKILSALKEKLVSRGVLTSPRSLLQLKEIVENNTYTDMTEREILSLASLGNNVDTREIVRHGIHDDPSRGGGILFSPNRSLYGGASVLRPQRVQGGDDWDKLRTASQLMMSYRDITGNAPYHLTILNGSGVPGMAGELKQILEQNNIDVRVIDTTEDTVLKTTFSYDLSEQNQQLAAALQGFVPNMARLPEEPYVSESGEVIPSLRTVLVLGEDYEGVTEAPDFLSLEP